MKRPMGSREKAGQHIEPCPLAQIHPARGGLREGQALLASHHGGLSHGAGPDAALGAAQPGARPARGRPEAARGRGPRPRFHLRDAGAHQVPMWAGGGRLAAGWPRVGKATVPGSSRQGAQPPEPAPAERGRRPVRWLPFAIGLGVVAVGAVAFAFGQPTGPTVPAALKVHVLRSYPHDRGAFTQGLVWNQGHLYESTGLHGQSSLREVDLHTGHVLRKTDLDPSLFGEGLALVGHRLWQLTWQSHRAFVWDVGSFTRRGEHRYDTEGWGLCYDGRHLVMSDGSEMLTIRDPHDFHVLRDVRVMDGGLPVRQLNELECVDGEVYANVWQTDRIVRIDPSSGAVTANIDAAGLLTTSEKAGADVLNGIAYLPERHHFLITGKKWPKMFEVVFVPR